MSSCSVSPYGVSDSCTQCCPSPLEGAWFLHQTEEYVPVGEDAPFHFNASREDQGYTWYSSDMMMDQVQSSARGGPQGVMQATIVRKPMIEIGLREEVSGDTRTIWLKFRGTAEADFWSGDGSYANPGATIVADMPVSSDCFVFDSIDLARVCDQCVSGADIATLILQREELCGEEHMIGVGGERGALLEDNCTVPCGTQMPGTWRLHHGATEEPLYDLNVRYTFSETETDADGFTWYESSSENDMGTSMWVGLKDDFEGDVRVIRCKVYGYYSLTMYDGTTLIREFWSNPNGGNRNDPGAFIIKEYPEYTGCNVMDEFILDGKVDRDGDENNTIVTVPFMKIWETIDD